MLIYLLKFSACLAIFVVFYKLFLERERMHQLKRIYLLGAIFISLSFPLITFTTYVEPIVVSNVTSFESFPEMSVEQGSDEAPATNFLPIILWSIYGLGVLLFGIKFILNLSKIVYKIKRNPKNVAEDYTHVLLRDLVTPHTFFNYIFLNKQKFETQQIPREVFIHEETHAKQKHSIDVLLVELLQVVFWFNPLIYLTKQFIKMNHEFLADEAVIKQGIEPSNYQQLLLTFSSNVTEPQLANAINYSSIKKRFTVMKTHTSKQKIWIRSFLLLPLIALTLYGFSQKKEVVKEISIQLTEQSQTIQGEGATTEMMKEYNDWIKQLNNSSSSLFIPVGTFERLVAIYDLMSEVQRNSVETHPFLQEITSNLYSVESSIPTTAQFESWKNQKEFAIWLDGKHISNSELNNYNRDDIAHYVGSNVHSNAQSKKFSQPFQFSLYTKDGLNKFYKEAFVGDYRSLTKTYSNAINTYLKGSQTDNSELKILKAQADRFYNQFNKDELKEYGILPAPPVPAEESSNSKMLKEYLKESVDKTNNSPNHNQSATPEEVAEYNKLASQQNDKPESLRIIKQKDFERMEYLYKKMSKEQKANAEPFPNFPPPPSPETGFIEVNGETLFYVNFIPTRYYNKKGYLVDKNGKTLNGNNQVNASDVLPGQYITKVYKDDKVVAEFKDNGSENIPPPPPPPATQSPLDHVVEMAQNGATFFYQGKSISSEEAIELIKSNNKLYVSTFQKDSNQPIVHLTIEPVNSQPQTKSKEIVMINGEISKDGFYIMSKEELSDVELTIKEESITNFNLKIPGKPTMSIKGNVLNNEAKALLKEMPSVDTVQLFMIKNSNNGVHPPILIKIK